MHLRVDLWIVTHQLPDDYKMMPIIKCNNYKNKWHVFGVLFFC